MTSLPQDENVHITQTLDALADAMDSRDDVSRVMDVWLVEVPDRLTALRAATATATADSESLCTAAHTGHASRDRGVRGHRGPDGGRRASLA